MSFQPRIFTFYSYKGGVGRSMALLNMAYYLQARGRHVLIVDLDLEAPGASGFLHRSEELLPRESKGDVVDVLAAVVDAVKQASSAETEPQLPALQLKDYLRSVDPDEYATAVHPRAPRARLDVLGAEQEQDYTARFSALELSSLTADQVGDASDLLRGLLIQYIFPFHQPWQEEGAAPESTHYDYILVDSRTGLSEIGGLCVGPLADRLVVLCGLNDQNIEGTRQFMKVVGLKPGVRPANTEPYDDADLPAEDGQRPATLGPKPTLLVASPVPGGEMTYKKKRLGVLEKQLGMTPVKLSYHPHMALMETLFVRDHADEYLAIEYATLAKRLMSMVGDTSQQLMSPILRFATSRSSAEEAKSTRTGASHPRAENMLGLLPPRTSIKREEKPDAEDLLQRLARSAVAGGQNDFGLAPFMISRLDLPAEARAKIWQLRVNLAPTDEQAAQRWLEWADDLDTEHIRKSGALADFQAMDDKYRKAVALRPQFHQAFRNWGVALSQWAIAKGGAEAGILFAQACEKYQQAAAIQPDNHATIHNWALALSHWAITEEGGEAEDLWSQACKKYQQAAAILPRDQATLHNWGAALSDWANTKEGVEADTLLALACEKYQLAAAIQPRDHDTFYNWGIALTRWADTKEGAEADALLAQASDKYQQAETIQPSDYDTLHNWGTALSHWANTKQGAEAETLFAQACEKYQQAETIQPMRHEALHNWGSTLTDWAKTKKSHEAEELYVKACEKFQKAASSQPNNHATLYNWGTALLTLANTKSGVEAGELLAQAGEKFQQAATILPNDHVTLHNWGVSLLNWAKISKNKEADSLFAQAGEKFHLAIASKTNNFVTLRTWGNALLQWARTKAGAEADALFAQAGEKFEKLVLIQPDDQLALYDLGCIAALRGKVEEAVSALEKWKSSDPEANQSKLDEDSDFNLIRNDPRFQAFRNGLG